MSIVITVMSRWHSKRTEAKSLPSLNREWQAREPWVKLHEAAMFTAEQRRKGNRGK